MWHFLEFLSSSLWHHLPFFLLWSGCCPGLDRAAQFLGGFLLPDFGEQLQHSGSAQSDQPGITFCLYSWKLWQCIAAAPGFQDAQVGILGDQRTVLKIKQGVESKDLQQKCRGCCAFGVFSKPGNSLS